MAHHTRSLSRGKRRLWAMDMEIQQGRGIFPRRLRDKTQTESATRRKERKRKDRNIRNKEARHEKPDSWCHDIYTPYAYELEAMRNSAQLLAAR